MFPSHWEEECGWGGLLLVVVVGWGLQHLKLKSCRSRRHREKEGERDDGMKDGETKD